MRRFNNKVVVVTGGAGGMGASHVKRFSAEGASVVIADLATSNGLTLSQQLGDNAIFV